MARTYPQKTSDSRQELFRIGGVSVALLVLYWLSFLSFGPAGLIHSVTGPVFILFLPGALLGCLLGLHRRNLGVFALYAVALSFVVFTLLTVVIAVVLPLVGVEQALSALPLALGHTALITGLLALVYYTNTTITLSPLFPRLSVKTMALLSVPVVAGGAALAMNWTGSSLGMFLLVVMLGALILSSAIGLLKPEQYPTAVFAVSLSMLLHRNFVSDHVVGADVQSLYALSKHVHRTQTWSPEVGGSLSSLPAVTAAPASVSTLTGLPPLVTFKSLLVLLFSLVAVGVYYLGREVFDSETALYGAIFFTLYHVSFSFTPGKQLVAELFVVLLLFTLYTYSPGTPRATLIALLSAGTILTHYGMTYAFGFAVLFGAVVLAVVRRSIADIKYDLPIRLPVFLLGCGILWYWFTSPGTVLFLIAVPERIVAQIPVLVAGSHIEGSGASYVASETRVLDWLRICLYLASMALICLGVAGRAISQFIGLVRGENYDAIEYTAIAVPLLFLLASSYVFVLNLWADRVYQLVLVVLAVFLPVGYRLLAGRIGAIVPGLTREPQSNALWTPLGVFLTVLLLVNSGFLFAITGTADSSTFDNDANDLVFSDAERSGIAWIKAHANVSRTDEVTDTPTTDYMIDNPDRVQVFTDPTSRHLFRSSLSPHFYDVEIVLLKNRWRPSLSTERLDQGYIYVRKASVTKADAGETAPPSAVTEAELNALLELGEVAYENEDVLILEINDRESTKTQVESDNSTSTEALANGPTPGTVETSSN